MRHGAYFAISGILLLGGVGFIGCLGSGWSRSWRSGTAIDSGTRDTLRWWHVAITWLWCAHRGRLLGLRLTQHRRLTLRSLLPTIGHSPSTCWLSGQLLELLLSILLPWKDWIGAWRWPHVAIHLCLVHVWTHLIEVRCCRGTSHTAIGHR